MYALAMQAAALPTWFGYVRSIEWHFDVCLVAKAAGAFLIWKLVVLGIPKFGFYLFRRKVGTLIGINLTESKTRHLAESS